jgi:hypothetical protein
MVHTISKNIMLIDKSGNIIKDLKPGMSARVRIQSKTQHTIYDREFSKTINKNKQGE